MSEPLLRVRELRKEFPLGAPRLFGRRASLVAVDGVCFDLERGECLGLVGESGCGKSTLARVLAGLQPASSGSARFDGRELVGLSRRGWRPLRRRLQMVFQDPYASLDPRQTVGSILAEPLAVHRLGRPRARRLRALGMLDAVGLDPAALNRYPHEFSGGQRQRIGIARALVLEPELVLFDEPLSALDVSIQAQILNLLRELQQRFGLTYLFIAHDLAVVRHLCSRVAVMYLGRLAELGSRAQVYERPAHPYTEALLSAVPLADPERERSRRRILLGGDVPDPAHPPSGCAFHPRCHRASEVPAQRCARERPRLEPRESGHGAACHLAGDPPGPGG